MVRRGGRGEAETVSPGSSPSPLLFSCLFFLACTCSIQGGISLGSPLPKFPVSTSAMAWSFRKKRAEDGAGWRCEGRTGFCFSWGWNSPLLAWSRNGVSAAFADGVWSKSHFLTSIFFQEELCFTVSSIVLCRCPSGVSSSPCAGFTCVAHIGETFPLEPGKGR